MSCDVVIVGLVSYFPLYAQVGLDGRIIMSAGRINAPYVQTWRRHGGVSCRIFRGADSQVDNDVVNTARFMLLLSGDILGTSFRHCQNMY
jgi:hypothetical protein